MNQSRDLIRVVLFGVLTVLAASTAALFPARVAAQDFTVSFQNMTDYTINSQPDPALTLIRGHSYVFAINSPGHPFYIKTAQVTGTGSQYTMGVTSNGATSGMLTFVVPVGAPPLLYYQCGVHGAMTGVINIVDPVPVPAGTIWPNALLASLLLGAAWLVTRGHRA